MHAAATATATARTHRDALITEHMAMTIKMARKMARRLPAAVSRDDVECAALLGLTEAAERYDAGRAEPFMAFAGKRVRGAILDHLRQNDLLSRRARRGAREVAEVAHRLTGELGRAATDSDIAEAMGLSDDELYERYGRAREATVVHLDELRGELADHGAAGAAELEHRKAALVRALADLDERSLQVLSLYYRDGLTLREIGSVLGVTESRVCQLHTQALRQLRERLS